jgi:hypothetical protein
MKKKFFLLLSLQLLLLSCGKGNLKLNDFKDYKIKVETKTHESSEMKYSMLIPETWAEDRNGQRFDGNFSEDFHDTVFTESMFFSGGMSNFCMLDVDKSKSSIPNLKDYFESMLAGVKKQFTNDYWKLFEAGKTDFLKHESYFIHYKGYMGMIEDFEGFQFMIKAKEEMTYYTIGIIVPLKDKSKLKDRIGMLLTCVRSFEMK